ncbi:helix-turn-helix domain-containing protein [Kocuria rhizophila]|uniref:helix-turn-helix domain-containing protein n=1 Tax=Kocuria rhizophila TaxID=72000 RepID=UPI001FD72CC5|nr:helix-turn-helix domain-containing protein [Kocuria rhizophila]MDN3227367.1 helix-turn-helix domain-containing protein [Kocuria rhizophila]
MANEDRAQTSMPNLVSLVEAADQFGVSVKTLRRRISDGTIHGYRVGRLIRVDLKELHERLLIEMPTMR